MYSNRKSHLPESFLSIKKEMRRPRSIFQPEDQHYNFFHLRTPCILYNVMYSFTD